MVRIELTESDIALMCDVLERDLADLRHEIARTDAREFRSALKQREEALTALRMRLGSPVEPLAL